MWALWPHIHPCTGGSTACAPLIWKTFKSHRSHNSPVWAATLFKLWFLDFQRCFQLQSDNVTGSSPCIAFWGKWAEQGARCWTGGMVCDFPSGFIQWLQSFTWAVNMCPQLPEWQDSTEKVELGRWCLRRQMLLQTSPHKWGVTQNLALCGPGAPKQLWWRLQKYSQLFPPSFVKVQIKHQTTFWCWVNFLFV